jgi:tRNA threonylcarbamoyladenosine biosynthesis protein TsaE
MVGSGEVVTLLELERVAADVWSASPPGAVVWLSGELGSGKTTFVQLVARAAGAAPAKSPTFTLVNEYPSPHGPILHVDCYRLRAPDEARELDFPELARRSRLLLVEWPERAGHHAPAPTHQLQFFHTGDRHTRRLERVS